MLSIKEATLHEEYNALRDERVYALSVIINGEKYCAKYSMHNFHGTVPKQLILESLIKQLCLGVIEYMEDHGQLPKVYSPEQVRSILTREETQRELGGDSRQVLVDDELVALYGQEPKTRKAEVLISEYRGGPFYESPHDCGPSPIEG